MHAPWMEDFNQDIYCSFDLTDTLLYHESFGLLKVTGHSATKRELLLVEQLEDDEDLSLLMYGCIDMSEDGGFEIVTLVKKPIDQVGDTTLYIGAPTGKKAVECKNMGWGAMLTPEMFRNSAQNKTFAMDNGVFAEFMKNPSKPFSGEKFIAHLDLLRAKDVYPDFVVIPDKIGDNPIESLEMSLSWINRLRDYPFPLYFVVQDGMTTDMLDSFGIPKLVDGLFVGGKPTFRGFGAKGPKEKEPEWKIKTGEMWVKYARSHGIRSHIGRTSSVRRLQWARSIKADSCDTSQPVFSNSMWNGFIKANKQLVFQLVA